MEPGCQLQADICLSLKATTFRPSAPTRSWRRLVVSAHWRPMRLICPRRRRIEARLVPRHGTWPLPRGLPLGLAPMRRIATRAGIFTAPDGWRHIAPGAAPNRRSPAIPLLLRAAEGWLRCRVASLRLPVGVAARRRRRAVPPPIRVVPRAVVTPAVPRGRVSVVGQRPPRGVLPPAFRRHPRWAVGGRRVGLGHFHFDGKVADLQAIHRQRLLCGPATQAARGGLEVVVPKLWCMLRCHLHSCCSMGVRHVAKALTLGGQTPRRRKLSNGPASCDAEIDKTFATAHTTAPCVQKF